MAETLLTDLPVPVVAFDHLSISHGLQLSGAISIRLLAYYTLQGGFVDQGSEVMHGQTPGHYSGLLLSEFLPRRNPMYRAFIDLLYGSTVPETHR